MNDSKSFSGLREYNNWTRKAKNIDLQIGPFYMNIYSEINGQWKGHLKHNNQSDIAEENGEFVIKFPLDTHRQWLSHVYD